MSRARGALGGALLLSTLLAGAVAAHGPTVRIDASRVRPTQLALHAGDTVHFVNGAVSAFTLTVRADDGSFESPALPPGGSWHHTFEEPGSFGWSVVERGRLRGAIRVAPKPGGS